MANLTPEYTPGNKKFFPLQSSLSGYSPEYTIGGKQAKFPGAQSALAVGPSKLTPERNSQGAFYPVQSQVNT